MGVDEEAWERAYAFIRAQPGLVFGIAGKEAPLPPSAMACIRAHEAGSPLLQFRRGGIEFACHFFCSEEIELDFWPWAIEGQQGLDELPFHRGTGASGPPRRLGDSRKPAGLGNPPVRSCTRSDRGWGNG